MNRTDVTELINVWEFFDARYPVDYLTVHEVKTEIQTILYFYYLGRNIDKIYNVSDEYLEHFRRHMNKAISPLNNSKIYGWQIEAGTFGNFSTIIDEAKRLVTTGWNFWEYDEIKDTFLFNDLEMQKIVRYMEIYQMGV